MTLERYWVRLKDSPSWRKRASSTPMRKLFKSRVFQRGDTLRRFWVSKLQSRRYHGQYRSIETLCLEIGHTKSGGTLIGAMLDAHPEIAMADELDVLRFMSDGFDIDQVTYLIGKASRQEAMKDRVTARRLEPYSFAVPGQSQGQLDGLRVIGDAKAGIATQRLGRDPSLLPQLLEFAHPLRVKFIHVVRNPFDPIGVMRIRGNRTFGNAAARYFENCRFLDDLRARIPKDAIRTIYYESMVADPTTTLRELCRFLDLDASDAYLEACSAVIGEPRQERTLVDWTDEQVEAVAGEIARHNFLHGYSFEGSGVGP